MSRAGSMVVVDTGPLYANVDAADPHHVRCSTFLNEYPGALIVPQLVVAEVAYLLVTRIGTRAELLFLADVMSGGLLTEPVHVTDWLRMAELVKQYRDFPLGTVDASVVACAERLGVTAVATLDHRHFAAVRPRHVDALDLLP